MAIDMAQFHEMFFAECKEHCSRAANPFDDSGGVGADRGKHAAAIEALRLIKGAQVVVSASGRAISLVVDAAEQVLTPSCPATSTTNGADEDVQIHGVLTIKGRSVNLIDVEGLIRAIGLVHSPAECELG